MKYKYVLELSVEVAQVCCMYSLVQKEPATLVFYYINQEKEMALTSKVKVV